MQRYVPAVDEKGTPFMAEREWGDYVRWSDAVELEHINRSLMIIQGDLTEINERLADRNRDLEEHLAELRLEQGA